MDLLRSYYNDLIFADYKIQLGIYFLIWIVTYFLMEITSPFLFGSRYRDLSREKKTDWNSRWVSNIHAVWVGSVQAYYFIETWPGTLIPYTSNSKINILTLTLPAYSISAILCTASYLLYDFILILLNPFMWSWAMAIHHVTGFLYFPYLVYTSWGPFVAAYFQLTEWTTPFINNHTFLSHRKTSSAYLLNGICMWAGFTFFRMKLSVGITSHFIQHHWDEMIQLTQWPLTHPIRTSALISLCLIPLALNAWWSWILTKGLFKALGLIEGSSSSSSSVKSESKKKR